MNELTMLLAATRQHLSAYKNCGVYGTLETKHFFAKEYPKQKTTPTNTPYIQKQLSPAAAKPQPKQEVIKPSIKPVVEEVLTKKPVTTEDPLLKLAPRPYTPTEEPYFEDILAALPKMQIRKDPIPQEVTKSYLATYPKLIILSYLPASFDSFIQSITQAVNTRVAKALLIPHPEIKDWVEIITYASTGNVSAIIAFTQNEAVNCFSPISAFTSTLDLKATAPNIYRVYIFNKPLRVFDRLQLFR